MKAVDGAPFVTMHQPRLSKILGEYCYEKLPKKIVSLTKNIERGNFVFDTYLPNSDKTQTRECRGVGMRVSVRKKTPFCNKLQDFLRSDENKTELFIMIADALIQVRYQK